MLGPKSSSTALQLLHTNFIETFFIASIFQMGKKNLKKKRKKRPRSEESSILENGVEASEAESKKSAPDIVKPKLADFKKNSVVFKKNSVFNWHGGLWEFDHEEEDFIYHGPADSEWPLQSPWKKLYFSDSPAEPAPKPDSAEVLSVETPYDAVRAATAMLEEATKQQQQLRETIDQANSLVCTAIDLLETRSSSFHYSEPTRSS